MEEDEDRWLVGVDWASQSHRAYLLNRRGKPLGERDFAHSGTGLAELAAWVLERTGAEPHQVWVAIETPHGPVVEALMERGFRVFSINPKQLDRFRDRFSPAGAKDDSRDAHVLADALRTDPQALRELAAADPAVVELREWSRLAEDLQQERTRLANRVRDQLWRYYPQALELSDDLAADWFLELWAMAPTPQKAKRTRSSAVARLLARHRIRRIDAAGALAILNKPALKLAPGTSEAATAHIKAVAARLQLVNRQIKEAQVQLDRLIESLAPEGDAEGQLGEQRDVTILRSLPGVGRIVLATLLAEAGEPLQRRDYHALRGLCGTAPVTKRSGRSMIVLRRRASCQRLVNAVYHWARVAVQHDPRSRAKYAALRGRGHGHARALRSVADPLLAVACAMLQDQTEFDITRAGDVPVATA